MIVTQSFETSKERMNCKFVQLSLNLPCVFMALCMLDSGSLVPSKFHPLHHPINQAIQNVSKTSCNKFEEKINA